MKRTGRRLSFLKQSSLVLHSPLRHVDPRVKLAMCLCVSMGILLPLPRLVVFMGIYLLVLLWARLLPSAAAQVWRLKWVLLVLFVFDWWLISLNLAVTITLRLILLACVLSLVFATTTPVEFTLALEKLGLPYRYAFSIGLAFHSLGLVEEEWLSIQEAQTARGAYTPMQLSLKPRELRKTVQAVGEYVSLVVPTIVLAVKRAWSITEAAYARGFDSPERRPYRQLRFTTQDVLLMAASLLVTVLLLFWR